MRVLSGIMLFVMLQCGIVFCYGQGEKKAASERYSKYKSSSSDEASSLLNEAYALREKSPGEALDKVEEALGISIAQKNDLTEAKCYLFIGEINEGISEWQLADDNYRKAYDKLKYRKSDDKKASALPVNDLSRILNGLGNCNRKLGRYEESIAFYQEAFALAGKGSAASNQVILKIAEVQYEQQKYQDALKTLKRISYGKTLDEEVESSVQNLEARILAKTNELSNSSRALDNSINSSLNTGKEVSPTQVEAIKQTKEEISEALRGQQRYDEDIELRNKSIAFNSNIKNLGEVAKDKVAISKSLVDVGEKSEALKQLEEAVAIADTLKDADAKAQAYLALANFYEDDGSANKALSAYKKYSEAVTSVKNQVKVESEQREELLRKQKEIEELSKEVSISQQQEKLEQTTVSRQKVVIYGLLTIILIVLVTSYFIYKNAAASKMANQMLALKSLRSQMNPHFIFNALNSVNHFIAREDERTANKFLSDFSQLMRLVLENSQEDFISLYQEQEIISLYLKLEHYRFRDKFEYQMEIDESINAQTVFLPPMLIQPYIENAVWHGLRYKETKGNLLLKISRESENLVVEIKDDGIGRKRSAELKTVNQKKHNSTGIRNIEQRLNILNKVYGTRYRVNIEDLPEGEGTIVRLVLPLHKNALME